MKTAIHFSGFLAAVLGGCLFDGEGTQGLPCNTDTECGGTQKCIEHVCGGPTAIATDVSIGGSSDESDSSGDEAPMETNDDDDDVRTECDASETQCLDGDTLRECTADGKLSTQDCAGRCGEGTQHNGCKTNPGGVDECWCLNAPPECADEGAYNCDGDNYTHCTGGIAYPTDCDEQCIGDGYAYGVSHCEQSGGDVTCVCWDGGPCEDGAAYCADDYTSRECWNGQWQNYDCAEIDCPEGTYSRGCTYFAGDTAGCGCWPV